MIIQEIRNGDKWFQSQLNSLEVDLREKIEAGNEKEHIVKNMVGAWAAMARENYITVQQLHELTRRFNELTDYGVELVERDRQWWIK